MENKKYTGNNLPKGEIISGVYLITNTKNEMKYIGQAIDIYKRWKQHIDSMGNEALHCAMRKNGIENFTFEILEKCKEDELDLREWYYITKYDSFNEGYNRTRGNTKHIQENFSLDDIYKSINYENKIKELELKLQEEKNKIKKVELELENKEKKEKELEWQIKSKDNEIIRFQNGDEILSLKRENKILKKENEIFNNDKYNLSNKKTKSKKILSIIATIFLGGLFGIPSFILGHKKIGFLSIVMFFVYCCLLPHNDTLTSVYIILFVFLIPIYEIIFFKEDSKQ